METANSPERQPAMEPRVPEPFRNALRRGKSKTIADHHAGSAEALYGRGLARIQVGRDEEARKDFEAARAELGDVCEIELAYLDLRQHAATERALERAFAVRGRAQGRSFLAARAAHIEGLALGRLRRPEEAAEALVESLRLYGELGDRRRQAEVEDTLGMLAAADGQLDAAAGYFALSIVEKVLAGDKYGVAVTLGNLGRLHLRAGRFAAAQHSFKLDLKLATEMDDQRGRCRMLNDLAQACAGLGQWDEAVAHLRACQESARSGGYKDLEFFAHKDLALALINRQRAGSLSDDALKDAEHELQLAEQCLGKESEPYLKNLLFEARGALLHARGDRRAVELLEEAARRFGEARLPDLEIPALVTLAGALAAHGYKGSAESALAKAMVEARRDGYARYLPGIRSAMAALDAVESAVEEKGRLVFAPGRGRSPDGYTNLRCVGEGGYGDVWRALDPRTHRVVAIKRLRLDEIYDPRDRDGVRRTMRRELEVASRLRHPGIARVLALGSDSEDQNYIVQEFVEGKSLRDEIPEGGSKHLRDAVRAIGKVAASLAELHRHEICHRDVKPDNIILRANTGDPVLIDFGLAYVPGLDTRSARRLLCGTLHYMAPEQLQGRRIDGRADIYGLGVTFYEWLTGRLPKEVKGHVSAKTVKRLLRMLPVPLHKRRADLPAPVIQLVDLMTAQVRRKRLSAIEALDRCRRLLRDPAIP